MRELAALLTHPQGAEFCIRHRFPTMETFRLFSGKAALGVYIDSGEVSLRNPEKVVLVGRTSAKIIIDENAPHYIYLMRGSQATIIASGWGFCAVDSERGCDVCSVVSGNAVIL